MTKNLEPALQSLANQTAYVCGQEFFEQLVESLAEIFGVSTVFIAYCLDTKPVTKIRTLALSHKGNLLNNITYPLGGTPCQVVYENGSAYFPANVQKSFPDDDDLKLLNVESYGGLHLLDSGGETIGHLGIMDVSELPQDVWEIPALKWIQTRCGAEIERLVISEQKKQIRQSYESIIECSTDGMFLKDANGEFVFLNQRCIELFGLESESAENTQSRLSEDWKVVLQELDIKLAEAGSPVTTQLTIEPNGTRRIFQLTQTPTLLENGEIKRIAGVVRDVTELVESHEVLNENLRLASLGTIAAGIAHEINNPLTAIQLATEVALRDSDISQGVSFHLESILDSVNSASLIVDEVLRTKNDRKTDKSNCNVVDIVKKAIDQVRGSSQPARIELDSPDECYVQANSIELRQVFLNLVQNAVQASGTNCAQPIRISVIPNEEQCSIIVRDYGCGIDEQTAQKIFDPFFTTRREHGGSGLGLCVSRRIVIDHAGTISCPKVEKGAKFVVSLPVKSTEHECSYS